MWTCLFIYKSLVEFVCAFGKEILSVTMKLFSEKMTVKNRMNEVTGISQVKIQNWINGEESTEYVGVGARFGKRVLEHEEEYHSVPLAVLDPIHACNESVKMVTFFASSFLQA
jgi:hypothetical protein